MLLARPKPGDVLGDKFRIVRLLGEGGMGVVYEAEHLTLGGAVAIKILRGDEPARTLKADRLLREARAAARIKSEHVAGVTDFGSLPNGAPFLVMELVQGSSLAQVLRARGPLEVETAARYALEVCLALAEAHALGIVHRDVKPSNLIVAQQRDGSKLIKVLDFGVAKQLSADPPALTASSGVLGSPSYMSPEQIRDAHCVDERTDVWSLGVVLYEMLTCRLPFEAFTTPGVLAAISADEPVLPTQHRAELDAKLQSTILRCLTKDRERRYPRVVELAEDLAMHTAAGTELARRVRNLREVSHERAPALGGSDADQAERSEAVETEPNETAFTKNAISPIARLTTVVPDRSRAASWVALVSALAAGTTLGVLAVIGGKASENDEPPVRRELAGAPLSVSSTASEVLPDPSLAPSATRVDSEAPFPSKDAIAAQSVGRRKLSAPSSRRASASAAPAPTASAQGPAAATTGDFEYGYRK